MKRKTGRLVNMYRIGDKIVYTDREAAQVAGCGLQAVQMLRLGAPRVIRGRRSPISPIDGVLCELLGMVRDPR